MRKFTLLIASLFITMGAMAQTYTIAPSSGSFNKSGWAASWTSSGLDVQTTFSVHGGANNMDSSNTTDFAIYSGTALSSTYVLAVDANYKIVSYSFKFASNNGNTITAGDKVMTANTTEQQTFEVTDVNSNSTSFVLAGANSGISITDFTITVESLGTTYEEVTNPEAFTSGKVYTFESQRGWLMAKEGVDYVYCSGKSGANLTIPAYDNAYCQWVYYATENGKYLYNVAAEKFISYNSSDLTSIPLAAAPASGAIEFKASTLTTTYPILLGLESAAINHNISNTNYTYGALLWSDGWTQTQWAGDAGSAHRVMELFDAETDVLSAIESVVSAFEADNTEAVAELDEAIDKAIELSAFIGTGVGKYSYTGDGDYQEKFAAIVAFRDGITETNTPTPEEVAAKTAELNALLSSFVLNMPEKGKYYRFKDWDTDNYMLSDEYSSTRLAMGTNEVSSIFYYGEDGSLLSYANGCYLPKAVANGDWTCLAVGTIGPAATFGEGTSVGTYGFYVGDEENRAYYSGRNTYVDVGGKIATNNGYDWILEEVTELPVTISEAGFATLYAPVALKVADGVVAYTVTLNGQWATLNKIESGVIPANTGVVLAGEVVDNEVTPATAYTYDFVVTTTDATVASDLRGSAPATYYTEAGTYYALAQVDEVVGFYKDQFNNSRFQNNSHKAYLYVAEAAGIASYSFRFGEGTTGVEKVEIRNEKSEIYDLTGRRVEAITAPGIYIVGGKKVLVK